MNNLVNFETKRLLFDKGWKYELGFDETGHKVKNSLAEQRWNKGDLTYVDIAITEVVMWLYEKYGVWIHADYYNDGNGEVIWFYNYKTVDKESMDEGFNSPTEAYEAAITYCLENLIQGGNK